MGSCFSQTLGFPWVMFVLSGHIELLLNGRKKRRKEQRECRNNGEFYLLYLLGIVRGDNVCKTLCNLRNHFNCSTDLKNAEFQVSGFEYPCLVLPDSLGLIYLWNFSALVAENSITWPCAKYSIQVRDLWRHTCQGWESNWKLSSPVWCVSTLYFERNLEGSGMGFGCHGYHKLPSHYWGLFICKLFRQSFHPLFLETDRI